MYQCEHFSIEELVPPETLEDLGEYKCWWLFDDRLLKTIDLLRTDLSISLVINNWKWGGHYKYSGFRPEGCEVGAKHSQHRYGRAVDIKIEGELSLEKADKVREHIRQCPEMFQWITTLETGITWLHIDLRNEDQFLEFSP